MTFPFVRLDGTGAVTGRCVAADLREAQAKMPCGRGECVTSEASYRLGFPRAVRAGMCGGCGRRPKIAGARHDRCEVCIVPLARDRQERVRLQATPWPTKLSAPRPVGVFRVDKGKRRGVA